MAGVTDCYQPLERKLQITRSVLQVMLEAKQSVMICTKNALVLRDLDILTELAAERLRRQIGARPCVVGAEHTKVPVTISVGIALSGLAAGQRPLLDEMFSQADAALYAAKSAGRNAVSMACAAA